MEIHFWLFLFLFFYDHSFTRNILLCDSFGTGNRQCEVLACSLYLLLLEMCVGVKQTQIFIHTIY